MKTSRKIGILGGTFNPIHYGHLFLAENARQQFGLDEVWFIPTGVSPHKKDNEILDAAVRMDMIKLAVADHACFRLETCEVESHEVSYTFRTIEKLHEKYPDIDFYFIMGADSLFMFDTWVRPEKICRYSTILTSVRDDVDRNALQKQIDYLNQKYHATIYPLNTIKYNVSSHLIRERIKMSETVRYLLPDAVYKYIEDHDIYK